MKLSHWICFVFVICTVGCGPESCIQRYEMQGEVRYQGEPLPYGRISFEPDGGANNRGPVGHAIIVDGKYDTRETGRGMVAGPQLVRIDGFSEPPGNKQDGELQRITLFSQYTVAQAFPAEDAEFSVEIPAQTE